VSIVRELVTDAGVAALAAEVLASGFIRLTLWPAVPIGAAAAGAVAVYEICALRHDLAVRDDDAIASPAAGLLRHAGGESKGADT
jgi:hypothetical protein